VCVCVYGVGALQAAAPMKPVRAYSFPLESERGGWVDGRQAAFTAADDGAGGGNSDGADGADSKRGGNGNAKGGGGGDGDGSGGADATNPPSAGAAADSNIPPRSTPPTLTAKPPPMCDFDVWEGPFTEARFFETYATASRPVLMRGLMTGTYWDRLRTVHSPHPLSPLPLPYILIKTCSWLEAQHATMQFNHTSRGYPCPLTPFSP
jgi:hypothetical protein